MQLKISKGNSKIGKIPNLSLPPGESCVKDIPCLTDGCYAMKSYRLYPNTKTAWDSNQRLWEFKPAQFFNELSEWLWGNAPEMFRLFVGGDFPDYTFYRMFELVCKDHSDINFLVFTKRYDYDFSNRPKNLSVILSVWPGYPLPKNEDLPWSWLEEDVRRPVAPYYVCPGKCDDCAHFCWGRLDGKTHVVFPRH